MAETVTLRGNHGIGEIVEGEAVVSNEGFIARYDYDRYRGVISRETHELFG